MQKEPNPHTVSDFGHLIENERKIFTQTTMQIYQKITIFFPNRWKSCITKAYIFDRLGNSII